MISTTVCPRSWNSRSFCSTTVWPRWRSGAVGSRPSLTRSGRPSARRCLQSALGQAVDGVAGSELAAGAGAGSIRPNARLPRLAGRSPPPLAAAHGPSADSTGAGTRHPSMTRSRAHQHDPPEAGRRQRRPTAPPRVEHAPATAARLGAPSRRAEARQAQEAARSLLVLVGLGHARRRSRPLFGMMMAVASDLPDARGRRRAQQLACIVDANGAPLGAPDRQPAPDLARLGAEIAPVMKHAIIAIEDQRFYTNDGVDLRGIARARCRRTCVQAGACRAARRSPQQFVKNALAAQNNRTRVREAARGRARLPPHAQVVQGADPAQLPQHDLLRQRRLRDRVGRAHVLRQQPPGLRDERGAARARVAAASRTRPRCSPAMVASPSAYDPIAAPGAPPSARRDLVLQRMLEQGYIDARRSTTRRSPSRCPTAADLTAAAARTREYPYFTSWVKQQVVDQLGGGQQARAGVRRRADGQDDDRPRAPGGRRAARSTAPGSRPGRPARLAGGDRQQDRRGPRDGRRRRLRARTPFNLATQGQRQPGSSFKPFVLAEALEQGISPELDVGVAQKLDQRPQGRRDASRSTTTTTRTRASTTLAQRDDVLRQLGLRAGRHQGRHARRSRSSRAGWASARRSRTNLRDRRSAACKQGVTPLDMAHAYETFAQRRQARLRHAQPGRAAQATAVPGPVGIERDRAQSDKPASSCPTATRRVNQVASRRGARRTSVASDGRLDPPARGQERHRHARADARTSRSPARPARPRTTATPGSSAGRPSTRSPSGSATRTSSSR